MPNGTFDDERDAFTFHGNYGYSIASPSASQQAAIAAVADAVTIDDGCAMMLDAFGKEERPCGVTPTVGRDGLHRRYCDRHMQMVAVAGATTLRYDARAVDDTDVPSPIDSDAPASVHGAADKPTARRCTR